MQIRKESKRSTRNKETAVPLTPSEANRCFPLSQQITQLDYDIVKDKFRAAQKALKYVLAFVTIFMLIVVGMLWLSGGEGQSSNAAQAKRSNSQIKTFSPLPGDPLQGALELEPGVEEHPWEAIVLHHSATSRGNTQGFDAFHRIQKGWRSLGYHLVIGNGIDMEDGLIEAGPRWKKQEAGAHANSNYYNRNGIGICLVGNFQEEPPTEKQLQATIELVRYLCKRYNIPKSNVVGHKQIRQSGGTLCPGKFFPLAEIKRAL